MIVGEKRYERDPNDDEWVLFIEGDDEPFAVTEEHHVCLCEIEQLRQRLAAAEAARAKDRVGIMTFMLRNSLSLGCLWSDCDHGPEMECVLFLLHEYDEAARAAGGRE